MYITLDMMKEQFGDNPNVRFREEIVDGVSLTIVCYMISDDDLWKSKSPLSFETRGATFNTETGALVALPFEKFFNVNEKEWTQAARVSDVMIRFGAEAVEKLDGSMINAALVNGKIHLKTKKSFESDVAIYAQSAMTEEVSKLSKFLIKEGYTPIFEFTSPENRIVIDYGEKPEFRLIAARCMNHGIYMTQSSLDFWAKRYGVARPKWHYTTSLEELTDQVEEIEGTEGWVIYTDLGRYKVKTKWYMDRHRMIDVRERDIAGYVLDETLDDLIPNLMEAGADMDRVRSIEREIVIGLNGLRNRVAHQADVAKAITDGKERAEWVKLNSGALAKFVHRAARGQENDDTAYIQFYRQHFLKDFSLKSIGNTNFRTEA